MFVKAVITKSTSREDVDCLINLISNVDPNLLLVLQPCTADIDKGVMKLCSEYQNKCLERCNNVRIIPQMHRFAGWR